MSKMTDEQIIKALKCCDGSFGNCDECPYKNTRGCWQLEEDAIDLINRQQAEIEKLERVISYLEGVCESTPDKVRAEAIKEFAERLKGIERWTPTDLYVIDNLVKEMGGEQE